MIRVNDVEFGYNGGGPVLSNIQMDLHKGDLLGIIGPNGSGKSTLLKLMSGTIEPRKGQVLLEKKEIKGFSRKEIARKIAVVPQESSLGFEYTVLEVVSMGRYPHLGRFSFSDPGGNKAVESAMKATGIEDLADKKVDKLSGGERQRVMIARSLAQEPKILMLDEPTKNLDIRHSLDIMDLISKWNRDRELTVVAVLHDLDLASRYCSSCLMLKNGRIWKKGAIEDVLIAPDIQKVFDVKVKVVRGKRHRIEIIG